MKYNKIFRILVVAIILSLLVIAIPASPALAAVESIDLSPDRGEIGDKIRVKGEDFDPDDRVYIYFSSQEAERKDEIDEDITVYYKRSGSALVGGVDERDEGEFSKDFYVPETLNKGDDAPEDVHSGTYYVYVTYSGSDDIEAVAEFTIRGIELDLNEGPVGTEVEISGIGFTKKKDIAYIKYDDETLDIESGDEKTDSDGEFTCTIIIPESSAAEHTITVKVKKESEASFTVEPEVTISPTSGSPATEVTISGTGFIANKSITITFNRTTVTTSPASVKSNGDGSFSNVKFNVPTLVSGTYEVEASDGINEDALNFTISITASLSPTTGNVGTALTVSGTGFVANRMVTIEYDAAQVATTAVEANGVFSVTFNAPTSKYGDHIIIANDGTNTRQFTFTMESTPPPTPKPLLPDMGSIIEKESPVYFDWKDVEDPSGVTYTLQIATDDKFTSIILEKAGLTDSEYTLTEEERLALVPIEEKEAVYYWTVKAVDGASNDSEWSSTRSFLIPRPGFALPDWIIYVWFAIGALLVGILCFWLGRRTTYTSF